MGIFDSAQGATDMSLDTMTEGMSKSGIDNLVSTMQAELLKGVVEKLKETEELNNAIKAGWQGKSRDVFLDNMEKAIKSISADLAAEYTDLLKRLAELINSYIEQDQKMVESI